jgi:halocyanin-like protein
MSDTDVSRRAFLRTATGGAAAATVAGAAAGTAAAQSSQPDFGGYLDGVDGGYQDARGQSEVSVVVGAEGNGGNLAFGPAGLWVDPGTTVVWEWNGLGGGHNVKYEEGPASDLDSGPAVAEEGTTYEYTFEEGGITKYYCQPHQSLGMLGAVAVGEEVPTIETGGGGGEAAAPAVPDSARALGVATTVAMVATLGLAFFFLKYGGDYDTPE